MHRPARWAPPREPLRPCVTEETPAGLAGVREINNAIYLLVVEQVLEIIFTLLTLKVPCAEEEPAVPVDPAPELPLTLPLALPEAEPLEPALPEADPLGLLELPLDAEPPIPLLELALPLPSEPLIRT